MVDVSAADAWRRRQRAERRRRLAWVAGALVALIAWWQWVSYTDAQDSAASLAATQAAYAEDRARNVRLERSAACSAQAISRGAQAATAVNGCLDWQENGYAIFLTACTESLLEEVRRPDFTDVDLAWFECLMDAQADQDALSDGY